MWFSVIVLHFTIKKILKGAQMLTSTVAQSLSFFLLLETKAIFHFVKLRKVFVVRKYQL